MAIARIKLAPDTWTDLSIYGTRFIVRAEQAGVSLALSATEPEELQTAIDAGKAADVVSTADLKPWARIDEGGMIQIDDSGPVILLGATTTAPVVQQDTMLIVSEFDDENDPEGVLVMKKRAT